MTVYMGPWDDPATGPVHAWTGTGRVTHILSLDIAHESRVYTLESGGRPCGRLYTVQHCTQALQLQGGT